MLGEDGKNLLGERACRLLAFIWGRRNEEWGRLNVAYAAKCLGVSKRTIARDRARLEAAGCLSWRHNIVSPHYTPDRSWDSYVFVTPQFKMVIPRRFKCKGMYYHRIPVDGIALYVDKQKFLVWAANRRHRSGARFFLFRTCQINRLNTMYINTNRICEEPATRAPLPTTEKDGEVGFIGARPKKYTPLPLGKRFQMPRLQRVKLRDIERISAKMPDHQLAHLVAEYWIRHLRKQRRGTVSSQFYRSDASKEKWRGKLTTAARTFLEEGVDPADWFEWVDWFARDCRERGYGFQWLSDDRQLPLNYMLSPKVISKYAKRYHAEDHETVRFRNLTVPEATEQQYRRQEVLNLNAGIPPRMALRRVPNLAYRAMRLHEIACGYHDPNTWCPDLRDIYPEAAGLQVV